MKWRLLRSDNDAAERWKKNEKARVEYELMRKKRGKQRSPSSVFRDHVDAPDSSDSEDYRRAAKHTPYRDTERPETRDEPVRTRRRHEGQGLLTQLSLDGAAALAYRQPACSDPTEEEEGGMNETVEMRSVGEEEEEFGEIPGDQLPPCSPLDRPPAAEEVVLDGTDQSGDDLDTGAEKREDENKSEDGDDDSVKEISQEQEEEEEEEADKEEKQEHSEEDISSGAEMGSEGVGGETDAKYDPEVDSAIGATLEEMAGRNLPFQPVAVMDEALRLAKAGLEKEDEVGKGNMSEGDPEDENDGDGRASKPPNSKA